MRHKNMKIWLTAALLLAVWTTFSNACVGRILYIGALENTEEQLMAEMLVILINERTGTNVKTRFFSDNTLLYQAFRADDEEARVDIIIEDTADAMEILGQSRLADPDQEYTLAKDTYEKERDVIWLNPFGFRNAKDNPTVSAPLIRRDVLTNFPLLPRVLNKLSGAIDNAAYTAMMKQVKSGSKARNVAKDFLKDRKFI
ncbi:MAG: hypothetical protein KJ950_15030 [Proteobacteria bacterium]|nr:hypothetical protein [Pseudomonadota bacterium]MBU1688649.1 hypothetical protein [Pseudomonadota bacterium]